MSITCQNTHTKGQNIPPAGFLDAIGKCIAVAPEAGSHLIAQAVEFSVTSNRSGSQFTAQPLPGSNAAQTLRQTVSAKQIETNEKRAIEAIKEHGKGYSLAGLFSRLADPNNASAKPLQHAIKWISRDEGAGPSKHEPADTATAIRASNEASMTKASGNIGGGIVGINDCQAPGASRASGGGAAGDGGLMTARCAASHISASDEAARAKAGNKAEPPPGFSFAAIRRGIPLSIGMGGGGKSWGPSDKSSIPISDARKLSCEFLNDVEILSRNRNTDLEKLNSCSVFDVLSTTHKAWVVDFTSSALRNQQFAPSEIDESTTREPTLIRRSQPPGNF